MWVYNPQGERKVLGFSSTGLNGVFECIVKTEMYSIGLSNAQIPVTLSELEGHLSLHDASAEFPVY